MLKPYYSRAGRAAERFFCAGCWLLCLLLGNALAGRAQAPAWQQPVSLDPEGLQGWAKATATAVDAAGNQYVTGYFGGTVRLGSFVLVAAGARDAVDWHNGSDLFVAKRSAGGAWLWVRSAGTDVAPTSTGYDPLDAGRSIAVDAAGNVYVAGHFFGSSTKGITFGSLPTVYGTSLTNYNIVVAKLDASGTWLWATAASTEQTTGYPSTINEGGDAPSRVGTTAMGLAVLPGGDLLVSGNVSVSATQGAKFGSLPVLYGLNSSVTTNGFVARLGAGGSWQWARVMQGPTGWPLECNGLGVDASGNAIVTGFFSGSTTKGATFGSLPTLYGLGTTSTAFSNVFVAKLDATGTWLWARAAGQPQPTTAGVQLSASGAAVAVDATGNSYVTGSYVGSATVGFQFGSLPQLISSGSSQSRQLFVAKLDAAGTWLWVQGTGSSTTASRSSGYGIGLDGSGNVYITGALQANASQTLVLGSLPPLTAPQSDTPLVASLDAAGTWRWAQVAGGYVGTTGTGPIGVGRAVAVAGTRVYMVGELQTQANFAPGLPVLPVIKAQAVLVAAELAASTGIWQAATANDNRGASGIWKSVHDAAGNEYVAGYFEGALTLGSSTLLANGGTQDLFVAKRNAAGTWLWAQRGGSNAISGNYTYIVANDVAMLNPYEDAARDLVVDASGNVYVVGTLANCAGGSGATFGSLPPVFGFNSCTAFASKLDIVVAKLDAAGTWQWVRTAGGTGRDIGSSVGLDAAGNVYVGGSFTGPASFGSLTLPGLGGSRPSSEVFVAKLDPSGSWLWATQAGTPGAANSVAPYTQGDDELFGLAVNAAGSATAVGYITGSTTASASFGSLPPVAGLGSVYTSDAFVARLDAAGTWQWAQAVGSAQEADAAVGVTLDAAGNAYVTGSFTGSRTSGGSFGTLAPVPGVGSTASPDLFVGKLSAAGTWQWVSAAGTEARSSRDGNDTGRAVALDAAGDVLVVGDVQGTATTPAQFGALAPLPVYAAAPSTATATRDVVAARLSAATGTWQWATLAGGSNDDLGRSIHASGANVYVAGIFQTQAAFDATTVLGAGPLVVSGGILNAFYKPETGFLARLGPAAAVISSFTPGSGSAGTTITLTGTGFTGATAVAFNGVAVPAGSFTVVSATTIVVSVPAGTTTGYLTVTTPAGVATSATQFSAVLATAPAAGSLAAAGLYPNPAHGTATLLVPAGVGQAQVELLDGLGRVVRRATLTVPAGGLRHELALAGLAPGLYALRLQRGPDQLVRRLVVE